MDINDATKEVPAESAENGLSTTNSGFTAPTPTSKSHLKKLKKIQDYAEKRLERRKQEKKRQKEKRKIAIENGLQESLTPSRKQIKTKLMQMKDNECALKVIIDLDYDDLMRENDIAKCIKQCLRMYTINRRAASPGDLLFTGIKTDGNIHQVLKKNHGWENWHVKYHFDKTYTDIYSTEKLLYLSSESNDVLKDVNSDTVYIIGGLVDHNHHKGLCYERAVKSNIKTARLPLDEFVDMKTRSVLSTFHVFEILLHVSQGKSWTEAILQTLPQRKGAKRKNNVEQQKEIV